MYLIEIIIIFVACVTTCRGTYFNTDGNFSFPTAVEDGSSKNILSLFRCPQKQKEENKQAFFFFSRNPFEDKWVFYSSISGLSGTYLNVTQFV